MRQYKRYFRIQWKYTKKFISSFITWVFIGGFIGIVGGIVGCAFRLMVWKTDAFWLAHQQMVFLLPIFGLLLVLMYHSLGYKNPMGTNRVFLTVRKEEETPWKVAPLIFVATLLTHLGGGSTGREGAALQIGGSIGFSIGNLARLEEKEKSLAVLAGMSAVFSALFGTPVAAVLFALEVVTVGIIHYSGLLPCMIASFTGYGLSHLFGGPFRIYKDLQLPTFDPNLLVKVAAVGLACALLSILIVLVLDFARQVFAHFLKNAYLKIVLGSAIIIGLTMLFPGGVYNGSGVYGLENALDGQAAVYDFLLKLVFTAVSLGVGFKGGEIIPVFFIGATMGCVLAPILGLDPGMVASLAMIGTFCGAVNCPLTSIILGVEFFGAQGLPYYAVVCCISYLLSGYFGLYSSQKIMYSKLQAKLIDRYTKS